MDRYNNGPGGTRFDDNAALRLLANDQRILWGGSPEAKNGGFASSASSIVAERIVKDLAKAASPKRKN